MGNDIDWDEIHEELSQKSEHERIIEEKRNRLLNLQFELSEKLNNVNEALERLDNPEGKDDSVVIWGVGGTYINGTRIAP